MKIIDRYVAGTFLKNYLISFFVLVGMYIVLDMIFQFDELVEVNKVQQLSGTEAVFNFIRYAGDYYLYQSLLYFAHLAGIIPVVAASFTLMRMTRFNEMGALLATGMPVLRVAMPIIVVSLLLQGLLWVDQELLIPNFIHKIMRKHDYATETGSFEINAMRDQEDGKLFAARYYPTARPPRMDVISIIYTSDEGQVRHIRAKSATWNEASSRWELESGVEETIPIPHDQIDDAALRRGRALATARPTTRPVSQYHSDITPEEIRLYRSGQFVELLSTSRINELLKRPLSYGRSALLRVKHSRGPAQIALNMVLLLLAISAVVTRDPQYLKTAAAKCVVLVGMGLSAAFAAQELAGQPPTFLQIADIWPAIMAWAPVFLFAPVAIVLLARVKT